VVGFKGVYEKMKTLGANNRQVELDKFNNYFKDRNGRFMSREEANIWKCGFNSGYKSGNKRGREVKYLLDKEMEEKK